MDKISLNMKNKNDVSVFEENENDWTFLDTPF